MSVMSTRSVILTRTNEITPLTTVISTRRVWCWHVWVYIWLIRVKSTLVCDVHTHTVMNTRTSYVWTQTVISTRTSVIYICRVRFPYAEWFLHAVWCWHVWVWLWHSRKWLWHLYVLKPHSACRNHSCVCDVHTHTGMNTRTSVISTRRV
jgi:hypothetical protein